MGEWFALFQLFTPWTNLAAIYRRVQGYVNSCISPKMFSLVVAARLYPVY